MAFQEQVNRYRARGVAGQAATPDQSVYTAKNFMSDGTVKVGSFAFASDDPQRATGTGTGAVLGLVERNIVYPIYDVTQTASMVVPEGYALTIAVRGDYYVETTGPASVGEAVFASQTDGTIKTAAVGSTQSGYTETPWMVKDALSAGSAGDGKGLILISNWNTHVAAGGTASVNFDLGQATGTLAVSKGGTGAATAEAARTALGLGSIATENAPLAVDKGGTGAATAAEAKTNLEIS